MTTNNKFYKDICEKLTDETITGFHGDGYYLRETCKVYGYTYQNKKCKVKYLHDMAESICGSTFTGQHTTLYYLKNIAEKLTGETYSNHTENYFLEIIKENISKPTPAPTYTDVELTATKNILSYADNDYTVFTGQLVDEGVVVERAGVVFDVSIDGVSQGTVTTNDEGKFSYRYDSRGVGDIEFTFSDHIFVSKTYSIRDGIKYISSELTTAQSLTVPNLPTNFKCIFKAYVYNTATTQSNSAWLEIGSDSNNLILFGNTGKQGNMGIFVKSSGSYVASDSTPCISAQTWTELTYTYNNGVQTISDGTNTVTLTNSQITGRTYVYFRQVTNKLKEILFLPL